MKGFDVALGVSVIGWAVGALVREADRPLAVRLSLAGLDLVVGLLLLARRGPVAGGGVRGVLAALPSMLLGATALKLAAGGDWSPFAQALFGAGALGAAASLLSLGRSFAWFPAQAELVQRGPYRWVRHPAYLCELVMVAACALVSPPVGVPLTIGVALAVAWRIAAEERAMAGGDGWAGYRARVRWRLVPGLY